jgi:hypothetical protein
MIDDHLFGISIRMSAAQQQRWIQILTRSWTSLRGRPPQRVEVDIEWMSVIFGAGASPKTVKSMIYALPEADVESATLPADVVLIVDRCAVITPEGRILLDLLTEMQLVGSLEISVDQRLRALTLAASLRNGWHSRWLRRQFDSSMSAPVIGAGLFLLINGSVGERHALLMPSDIDSDRHIGSIVMPLIADFSISIGGQAPATDGGLRQHWAFTQLHRLRGREVARNSVDDGTVTFIHEGQQSSLTDQLAERLARAVDSSTRQMAITGFIDRYRQARGSLAAVGQMHEDPTATRRIAVRLTNIGAA